MGLDMYLYKKEGNERKEIAYWRKANQIHAWFERELTVNGIMEDCQEYPVDKETLVTLRDLCKTVLDKCEVVDGKVKTGEKYANGKWIPEYKPGKTIKNKEEVKKILPTQEGFFFGSTAYDQYYIDDLKNTIKQIDKILDEIDFDKDEVTYLAWW